MAFVIGLNYVITTRDSLSSKFKVDGGDEGWDNTEIGRRDIRSET